jgi:hypothetical protein
MTDGTGVLLVSVLPNRRPTWSIPELTSQPVTG